LKKWLFVLVLLKCKFFLSFVYIVSFYLEFLTMLMFVFDLGLEGAVKKPNPESFR
jgi:hypothetical protein